MISKKKFVIFFLTCILCVVSSAAISYTANNITHPFYAGITGGYGSTTWGELVPSENKASVAMSMSTPTSVTEGGAIWGVVAGYELIPTFAIEGNYTRYPVARINFDETSLFAFNYDGRLAFTTKTESTALVAKFMLIIPRTEVRAYSSAGVAGVHRYDAIKDRWRASPTFGIGLNYNLTEHLLAELGINYTGGYGESEMDPAEDFIPFLYSGFLRLAYRF
ncbi:MAG: hypothetical protein P4M12_04120 [Gammaproteobacteria bacterium]|nr:hypothetical protein [Gammaproteobacteria bacterium]